MAFLNTAQAAEVLRVSQETVRDWVKEGHLRTFRIGPRGQLRFKPEDLQAAMRPARGDHAEAALEKCIDILSEDVEMAPLPADLLTGDTPDHSQESCL